MVSGISYLRPELWAVARHVRRSPPPRHILETLVLINLHHNGTSNHVLSRDVVHGLLAGSFDQTAATAAEGGGRGTGVGGEDGGR